MSKNTIRAAGDNNAKPDGGNALQGVVKNHQIFFMLVLLITGYTLNALPKDAYLAAGTGAWFTLFLLTIIFMLGVYVVSRLQSMFEMQTICEYSNAIAGKAISKMLTALYAGYALLISILLMRSVCGFIKTVFLPETPISVLVALFCATNYYIAYKGLTSIGRLCTVLGAVFIVTSLFVHTVMFKQGDIKAILPLFEMNQVGKYIGAVKDLIVPFLGIELLTIVPFGPVNRGGGTKSGVLALLYVGFFYVIAVQSTAMQVGRMDLIYYENALIEGLRETKLPRSLLLERADLIYLVVGIFGIVACLCIVAFASTEFVYKLKTPKNRTLQIILVALFVFLSASFLDDDQVKFIFNNIVPYCGLVLAFVIPLALLIVAKIRKLGGANSPPNALAQE